MNFHIISIFPDFVRTVFEHGVVRRAVEAGRLSYSITDPRDFTTDRHRTTDDMPYGGGPGMVMLAEPLYLAVQHIRETNAEPDMPVIYLSPAGEPLSQALAEELSGTRAEGQGARPAGQGPTEEVAAPTEEGTAAAEQDSHKPEDSGPSPLTPVPCSLSLILLCGRYEGIDQRLLDELGVREISIGDYVISGGELAAMVLVDAVARLLPGVLGNEESSGAESFSADQQGGRRLDWPHYTRPENWRGRCVPEVLLSGNHAKILGFRQAQALLLTYQRRPELLTEQQRQAAEKLLEQAGQQA